MSTPTDTRHGLPTPGAMVDNILRVYHNATLVERSEGTRWYWTARHLAAEVAGRNGVTLAQAAAAIALLSPSNRWERNVDDADALIAAYRAGLSPDDVSVCTYNSNKAKAWEMLRDTMTGGRAADAFGATARKTEAFFRLILDPEDDDAVVIDGHAYCIAVGIRMPLKDVPNLLAYDRYSRVEDAYIEAAEQLGIIPWQLQAVTWIAWRNLHNV